MLSDFLFYWTILDLFPQGSSSDIIKMSMRRIRDDIATMENEMGIEIGHIAFQFHGMNTSRSSKYSNVISFSDELVIEIDVNFTKEIRSIVKVFNDMQTHKFK